MIIQIIGISKRTYYRRLNDLRRLGIIKFDTKKLLNEENVKLIASQLGYIKPVEEYFKKHKKE